MNRTRPPLPATRLLRLVMAAPMPVWGRQTLHLSAATGFAPAVLTARRSVNATYDPALARRALPEQGQQEQIAKPQRAGAL